MKPFLLARSEKATIKSPPFQYSRSAEISTDQTGRPAANSHLLFGTNTTTKIFRETSDVD